MSSISVLLDCLVKVWDNFRKSGRSFFLLLFSFAITFAVMYHFRITDFYHFMNDKKVYVYIIYGICGGSLFMCFYLYICIPIYEKWLDNKIPDNKKKYLDNYLSLKQKKYLISLLSSKDNAYYFYRSYDLEELVDLGIVYDTGVESDISYYCKRYIIDLKVRDYLRKHFELLDIEIV